MKPDISVVISTYNRAELLRSTLDCLVHQQQPPCFEVVVVDNNSSDHTAKVVAEFERRDPRFRYLFEGKQGVSYGRNAGIMNSQAPLIAFTDDDILPAADWLRAGVEVAASEPEYGFIGGSVLPRWPEAQRPSWLTPQHWAPLALVDFGASQEVGPANPKALITSNLVARRDVFDRIGLFDPTLQRVKDGVGSMEDREIMQRFWSGGGRGWYDTRLVVYANITPDRLSKLYHRRWHYGHGRFMAVLRDPDMERSRLTLFGVPGHVYRAALEEALQSFASQLGGNSNAAFTHETRARFFWGFMRKRWAQSS